MTATLSENHPIWDVIPTTLNNNNILIDSAYIHGRYFQWAREFLYNAIEAGATLISLTCDFVTARQRNIYRRMIGDNGFGMTRVGLSQFINQIGGGANLRTAGGADNLGQGAKVSSAYFNPAGVVYISRTVEDGDQMCIYVKSPVTGGYGLVSLWGQADPEDETNEPTFRSIHVPQPLFFDKNGDRGFDALILKDGTEYLTDWSEVAEEGFANLGNPEHGTLVVFLGEGCNDTIFGDPERPIEGTKYTLRKYLEARVLEIPEGISVRVAEFRKHEAENKEWWPESEKDTRLIPAQKEGGKGLSRMQWRYVKGIGNHIYNPTYLKDSGSVPVVSTDGIPARIDWVITDFATKTKTGTERKGESTTDINPGGIGTVMRVSAASKLGIQDVLDFRSMDSKSVSDPGPWFRHLGIDLEGVQQQLWFLITPQVHRPADRATGAAMVPGVHMDLSRSHLVGTTAERQSEPYETLVREWGKDFQRQGKFPPQIQALLDAEYGKASKGVSALDDRTTDRLAKQLSGLFSREIAILGGRKPNSRTNGNKRFGRKRRGKPNPDPNPNPNPNPRRRTNGGHNTGGTPSSNGNPATKSKVEAAMPDVVWLPGDDTMWQQAGATHAIAIPVLPGKASIFPQGGIYLRGHDPRTPYAERKRSDESAYENADDWQADEAPVILAAIQDKQEEYSPAQRLQVEDSVKAAYAACAISVFAHLLSVGKWSVDAKDFVPSDGAKPEQYQQLIEPWAFSVSLLGYYPQKQIASTYLGAVAKKTRTRSKKLAGATTE